MPVNNSPIHSIYLLVHPIPTGLGCIRNVARLPQLSNLLHISLQVSITSNKLCLKSNSLVQCMPSITLSSLSLLLLSGSLLSLLSISSLLSDSIVSLGAMDTFNVYMGTMDTFTVYMGTMDTFNVYMGTM